MKIAYNSKKTDPKNSSTQNYGWITIKDNKITQIGVESFREGGIMWTPNFTDNGNLKECMKNIARSWPNLYKKACKYCQMDKLPTIRKIKETDLKYEISRLEKDIRKLDVKLFKKKTLLRKNNI